MISIHIKEGRLPATMAVFSFRYDAHLVPALLANIDPLVDGWVAFDDRHADGLFSNEVNRRVSLLEAARSVGANWALAVDPDERFETPLAQAMPDLIAREGANAVTFPVREMYGSHHYRVDGLWGAKRQARLLKLSDGVARPEGELHLSWASFIPSARLSHTEFNLYHLKMITRERREARAALYSFLDPDRRMQSVGYDYLADDAGAAFERVGDGRGYHPPHEEDGGLWMAAAPTVVRGA